MAGAFYLFSTAGNTTLFVDKPRFLPNALEVIPAEQAACFNFKESSLLMAGGEFCLNACLAYGALLDCCGFAPKTVHIGGETCEIKADGQAPAWQTRMAISTKKASLRKYENFTIAHLPGISHALLKCEALPGKDEAFSQAAAIRANMDLDKLPAAGVVWWRRKDAEVEILPVVSVPGAGTVCLEGGCGSASLSLALALGNGKHDIRQQSGEILQVEILKDKALVEAPTRLQAKGELWLP